MLKRAGIPATGQPRRLGRTLRVAMDLGDTVPTRSARNVTDPELVMLSLEESVARATARAVTRLSHLPASERRRLDPYGFLLRPRGRGARQRD